MAVMSERERWLKGHITDDEFNRGAMVERYRAELMPNGKVRVFDQETQMASVWSREGGKVECVSGPWVMSNDVWLLAQRTFPADV